MLLLLRLWGSSSRSEMRAYAIIQHLKTLCRIIGGYLLVISVPVIWDNQWILKLFECVLVTSSSSTLGCTLLSSWCCLVSRCACWLIWDLLRLVMVSVGLATTRGSHLACCLVIPSTERAAFSILVRSCLPLGICPWVRAVAQVDSVELCCWVHVMRCQSSVQFATCSASHCCSNLASALIENLLVLDYLLRHLLLVLLLVLVHNHTLMLIESRGLWVFR